MSPSRPPANDSIQAAIHRVREKYREALPATLAVFSSLASRLAARPTDPEVVESVRRELHRLHGTAGSYGYHEASELAAALEERAEGWIENPDLDRQDRARMIQEFVAALTLAFDNGDAGPHTRG